MASLSKQPTAAAAAATAASLHTDTSLRQTAPSSSFTLRKNAITSSSESMLEMDAHFKMTAEHLKRAQNGN